MLHGEITGIVLRAFYDVYNQLGYGFLERVYENALAIDLRREGLSVAQQYCIDVYYGDSRVGSYRADLVVQSCVIIEVKAVEGLRVEHAYQLTNHLRATEYEVGLLLNFGKRAQFKRKYFTNDLKGGMREQKDPPY